MPSDSKTFFGIVVERLFELGHTMKSRCSRHLENIRALNHRVNSHRNIHKGYHCNPLREFKICSEMPSDSKQCSGFVVGELSELGHTRDSPLTGTVLQKLDTWQSENLIEFPRNISYHSSANCRSLFGNVKRFQNLLWLCSCAIFRAWAYYEISMFSTLKKCSYSNLRGCYENRLLSRNTSLRSRTRRIFFVNTFSGQVPVP